MQNSCKIAVFATVSTSISRRSPTSFLGLHHWSDRTRIQEHSLKINVQKYTETVGPILSLKRTLEMKLVLSFKGKVIIITLH